MFGSPLGVLIFISGGNLKQALKNRLLLLFKNHSFVLKKDIRSLSFSEIENEFAAWGEPSFRARQLQEWLWSKAATNYGQMSNLPKPLRDRLAETYDFNTLFEDIIQNSADGTVKIRWRLHDGYLIESVIIPVPTENRYTVCVSTQVGCSLTCTFCATGKMGRKRNLEAYEIVDQVTLSNQICESQFGHGITNVVYMGMGEPLLNYAATLKSVQLLTTPAPDGRGMGAARITVSTAGIAKMIRKLADDGYRSNLAVSLHAADDAKRDKIMPINESNNLEVLMEALEYFYAKTKNRISYEYIAFQEFNDQLADADLLVKLCRRKFPVRVNIIEYNAVDGVLYTKADENRLNAFAARLADKGVTVTVRRSRGKDIDAACGQLANKT